MLETHDKHYDLASPELIKAFPTFPANSVYMFRFFTVHNSEVCCSPPIVKEIIVLGVVFNFDFFYVFILSQCFTHLKFPHMPQSHS